jgi:hypothetical protein
MPFKISQRTLREFAKEAGMTVPKFKRADKEARAAFYEPIEARYRRENKSELALDEYNRRDAINERRRLARESKQTDDYRARLAATIKNKEEKRLKRNARAREQRAVSKADLNKLNKRDKEYLLHLRVHVKVHYARNPEKQYERTETADPDG